MCSARTWNWRQQLPDPTETAEIATDNGHAGTPAVAVLPAGAAPAPASLSPQAPPPMRTIDDIVDAVHGSFQKRFRETLQKDEIRVVVEALDLSDQRLDRPAPRLRVE